MFVTRCGILLLKGADHMPTIAPISDLHNYGTVLEKVSSGSPVYLTRNGRGVYSIRNMEDEEKDVCCLDLELKQRGLGTQGVTS